MARVLIVEDHLAVAELLRRILETEGHVVAQAITGASALLRVRSFAPDLVLLDMGLPDMTGYSVVHRIKRDPETAAIKVVAVTSHAIPGNGEAAMLAGCDAYIRKPVVPSELVRGIAPFLPGGGK